MIEYVETEKNLLRMAGMVENNFLLGADYVFQTNDKIYFVMRYVRGGDLHELLKEKERFSEDQARFYVV